MTEEKELNVAEQALRKAGKNARATFGKARGKNKCCGKCKWFNSITYKCLLCDKKTEDPFKTGCSEWRYFA